MHYQLSENSGRVNTSLLSHINWRQALFLYTMTLHTVYDTVHCFSMNVNNDKG